MRLVAKILLIMFFIYSCCVARELNRDYLNSIARTAIWINPRNIKVYVYPDETKEYLMHRSIKAWDDALRNNLNFKYVKKPQDADIIFKYVDNLDGKTVGITKSAPIEIQGKLYLTKIVVEIGKYTSGKLKLTDIQINETILHEIGHALGILGHSDNPADIMFSHLSRYGNTTLSSRDVDTIKRLYGFN